MKKSVLMNEMFKWGVLTAIIAVALPDLASAQSGVNALITDAAKEQLPVFPYILSAVCYVGGAFMMVSGALSLKKHAENPTSEPMSKGIARLVTGGAITAVPTITAVLQKSVMGNTTGEAEFTKFTTTF
ncbi:MAG: hypothetical protein WC612_01370 [Bdellovibrionales bacterium]